MSQKIADKLYLRHASAEDEEFLFRLYTAGRSRELEAVGWNQEQIQNFCEMQYRALMWQHNLTFQRAVDRIVELDGESIGRLKVLEKEEIILLVDIALLPEYQNQGIGTILLEQLKNQGRVAYKPVRLHVLVTSPGIRLYQRLGFQRISDDGSYIEMEFRSAAS